MNFDTYTNENKKTSIKCHQAAGGNSSFSLGWGNNTNVPQGRTHKRTNSGSDYNIISGEKFNTFESVKTEDKENLNIQNAGNTQQPLMNNNGFLNFNNDDKNCSIKTNYETGKNKFDIFKNEQQTPQDKYQSIKINQTPGGNSNFVFGNDKTSYDDYRKKR
jgi:hypothetical protein